MHSPSSSVVSSTPTSALSCHLRKTPCLSFYASEAPNRAGFATAFLGSKQTLSGSTRHSRTQSFGRHRGMIWKLFSKADARGPEIMESSGWWTGATPYEVLGLDEDCSVEDVKVAFRARVKEYHPDVYKGTGNAVTITKQLIQAYELLINDMDGVNFQRESSDPFEEPESVAHDIFVFELQCIGRGCPYSCVKRAPHVFKFAPDTGCARAVVQGYSDDYMVQLAVGQCPRNCIYYVTPLQRKILEQVLLSAAEGTSYVDEVMMLGGLLAKAKFENGRYRRG